MSSDIVLLDGGMGRELFRLGAPFRQPEWSALALMEGPEWVTRAHRGFIDAGAQVIITNTYAVVPFHIGEERFAVDGFRLATLAGECARAAVADAPHPVVVAGSLPPLFGSYRPDLFDAADAPRVIDPLIEAQAPYIDRWLGETLSSIAEMSGVRDALDRAGDERELWLSVSLPEEPLGVLRSGEPVADAARAALDLGATALLFNCCQVETVTPALALAAQVIGDRIPLGAYANRFAHHHEQSEAANVGHSLYRDDVEPDDYLAFATEWVAAGATIIGGCCGIGPDHIAALRSHFR